MADALEVEDAEAAGWFRRQAEEIESASTSQSDKVQDYFCRDGIHLTRAGYLRVAARFPAWLRVESE